VMMILLLLFYVQIEAQQSFIKPNDVFPQDPKYRPSAYDPKAAKNPFADTYNRNDPDDLFLGFFPIWSAILASIAVIFGFLSIFCITIYHTCCRNSNDYEMKKSKSKKSKIDLYFDREYDEADVDIKMLDGPEKDYEHSFKNSRLTSLA
jgi:hypothetical protein